MQGNAKKKENERQCDETFMRGNAMKCKEMK